MSDYHLNRMIDAHTDGQREYSATVTIEVEVTLEASSPEAAKDQAIELAEEQLGIEELHDDTNVWVALA